MTCPHNVALTEACPCESDDSRSAQVLCLREKVRLLRGKCTRLGASELAKAWDERDAARRECEELRVNYTAVRRERDRALWQMERTAQVWRDIAGAPRDGTHFLAWDPGVQDARVMFWDRSLDSPCMVSGTYSYNPTHWQPLPPPPKERS